MNNGEPVFHTSDKVILVMDNVSDKLILVMNNVSDKLILLHSAMAVRCS